MQPPDVAQRLWTLTSEYLWSIGAAAGVSSEVLSGARHLAQVLEVIPKKGDTQMDLNNAGEGRFPTLKLLSTVSRCDVQTSADYRRRSVPECGHDLAQHNGPMAVPA